MPRTSSSTVDAIFDTSLDAGTLDVWIGIANDLVDDIADADSSIGADRLEHIETLVAAHLAAAQDQRAESRSSASRSVSYQGDTGMHFESTQYGQHALSLDPTGTLAGSGKPSAQVSIPDAKNLRD